MTLLYHDPVFLDHDTGTHPECAWRLQVVAEKLAQTDLPQRCRLIPPTPIDPSALEEVHDASYISEVGQFAQGGGGNLDRDTVVSPRSAEVAQLAAGSVCDAVRRVLEGEDRNALCLVRPPGHHALPRRAMGFCLFNSVALGAQTAISRAGLERVLILDWDVHHGNGTQQIFWENEQVGFLSAHRWPFWPGSGAEEETGAGRGLGATRNLPMPFGISRREYRSRFESAVEAFAARIKPQLVMISAGFDAHVRDPLGSLGLQTEDFGMLTRFVLQVAAQYAQGRVVSVLEGGYHPPDLADCVALHLEELLQDD